LPGGGSLAEVCASNRWSGPRARASPVSLGYTSRCGCGVSGRADMWFVWSSGSKQAFRPDQLPAPRGHGRGLPRHPARWMRLRASRRIRAVYPDLSIIIVRGPSTGGDPRSVPRRLASPLPSTTFSAFGAWPSRSFRPGCVITRKCECATLLTLTPTFPSRPDPCGPAWSSRTSSLGVVQRSPLHRSESGSPSPRMCVSAPPFGEGQPVPLAFRPRGFAPPRRFAPPRPCRFVSPCSRSWGSPCFPSSRNEVPHSAAPALRSLPTADSCEDRRLSGSAGSRHGRDLCFSERHRFQRCPSDIDRVLHRAPCPLALPLRAAFPGPRRSGSHLSVGSNP